MRDVDNHRQEQDGNRSKKLTTTSSRRNVLSALSGAGLVGLAGCTGGGGGGDGGSTPTPRVETVVREKTVVKQQETTTVKFSLDWVPKGDHAGFHIAQNKGYWADRGVSVQMNRGHGSTDTLKQVATGKSEFGFIGTAAAAQGVSQGLDVSMPAQIFYKNPVMIAARKDANVEEPADLEGKKAVLPAGEYPAMASALFNSLGLDWDAVDLETRGYVGVDILVSNEADWMMVPGSDFPALWSQDFEFDGFNWFNENLSLLTKGIVVSDSYQENNPEVVRNFVEGSLAGWTYVLNNGSQGVNEAVDALFKFFPNAAATEAPAMDAKEFHRQNASIALACLLTEGTRENGLGYYPSDRVEGVTNIYNSYLLENEIAAEDVFMLDYIESGQFPIEFDTAMDAFDDVGGRPNPLM